MSIGPVSMTEMCEMTMKEQFAYRKRQDSVNECQRTTGDAVHHHVRMVAPLTLSGRTTRVYGHRTDGSSKATCQMVASAVLIFPVPKVGSI